ncbi:hypothetical protein [Streptomyces sp. NPDC058373]|uniref:hypothetical protein n=1 Tax=Streptomyces sp. NPDC058373 TaxID=3346465 RepID=UPI0036553090
MSTAAVQCLIDRYFLPTGDKPPVRQKAGHRSSGGVEEPYLTGARIRTSGVGIGADQ